jgi:hypothetical protein
MTNSIIDINNEINNRVKNHPSYSMFHIEASCDELLNMQILHLEERCRLFEETKKSGNVLKCQIIITEYKMFKEFMPKDFDFSEYDKIILG